jgi:Fe2+ or Zn2+ uptake regulation protein
MQKIESKEGVKYVRIPLEIWYDENDESIHLVCQESGNVFNFHSTVNEKDGSARCHKNLYKHLKQILIKFGKYPDNK